MKYTADLHWAAPSSFNRFSVLMLAKNLILKNQLWNKYAYF